MKAGDSVNVIMLEKMMYEDSADVGRLGVSMWVITHHPIEIVTVVKVMSPLSGVEWVTCMT